MSIIGASTPHGRIVQIQPAEIPAVHESEKEAVAGKAIEPNVKLHCLYALTDRGVILWGYWDAGKFTWKQAIV